LQTNGYTNKEQKQTKNKKEKNATYITRKAQDMDQI
jgi:hypothetical protein